MSMFSKFCIALALSALLAHGRVVLLEEEREVKDQTLKKIRPHKKAVTQEEIEKNQVKEQAQQKIKPAKKKTAPTAAPTEAAIEEIPTAAPTAAATTTLTTTVALTEAPTEAPTAAPETTTVTTTIAGCPIKLYPENSLYRTCQCPGRKLMEDMLKADPGGKKVFVDIGCNTGADAIDWFDMWGTQSGAGKKWREGLSTYGSWEGACSQNKLSDAPEIASTPGTGAPTLLCVEPMPSNFKILENLTLATKEFTGSFKAIQAAVSSDEGTVDFPDASDGTENQGIEVNHGHSTVSVKKTTVDALLKEEGLTKVDVLTIDTEGHDPAALKGADGLLKAGNVRFIIFEVHQDIEASIWEKSPLIDEVARLEKYGYDCYFAANTGNVGKLTGCWTEEFEKAYYPVGWSNVACALKGDVWHDVLEKRNKGITAES